MHCVTVTVTRVVELWDIISAARDLAHQQLSDAKRAGDVGYAERTRAIHRHEKGQKGQVATQWKKK
jgi:hypothetical protein